jgi:hypothetical protein
MGSARERLYGTAGADLRPTRRRVLPEDPLIALQRQAGNAAVSSLIAQRASDAYAADRFRLAQRAPEGDWDPKGPAHKGPPSKVPHGRLGPTPDVVMTPDNLTQEVGLGELHTRTFATDPAGYSVRWSHAIKSYDGDVAVKSELQTGGDNGSRFSIRPRVVGARTVRTRGHVRDSDYTGDIGPVDVSYRTPRPKVRIGEMNGVSTRGVIPLIDSIQSDETLEVKGVVGDSKGASVEGQSAGGGRVEVKAMFRGSAVEVDRVSMSGEHFTAELHLKAPTGQGHARGDLYIAPYEARDADIDPAKIDLTINESSGKEDFGPLRAYDIESALNQLRGAMHEMYDRQITALEAFEIQRDEVDPPPKMPMWQSILKGLVMSAISGVAGGLGVKLASVFFNEEHNPGWHEVLKTFTEQNLDKLAEEAIKEEGGELGLGMKASFHTLHKDILTKAKNQGVENTLTTAKYRAESDEKRQQHLGVRHLMEIAKEWSAMGNDAARDQFERSFQAWSTYLAQNATSEGGATEKEKESGEPSGPRKVHGTDLSPAIPGKGAAVSDIAKIGHVPGVLYIQIEPGGDRTYKEVDHWNVVYSRLPGMTNERIRNEVKKIAIGDLHMPAVVHYNNNIAFRFTSIFVARNELGEFFAWENSPGKLRDLTGLEDVKDAAATIFMDLKNRYVKDVAG